MSTRGFQDPQTSRAWQRVVSEELVEGVGEIVADFFDEGWSRRWSWWDRPEASALLAAAERPEREFDAVVVGEYERAFYGDQFEAVVTRLNGLGVQVWLPEAGGSVELGSPVHQALMVLLGAQAQREVVRARHRVKAAMGAQTRLEGRFLGGRPPYGYRLTEADPHPNSTHAQWGRCVHVLEPDPTTAPWVRWMFAERARGRSVASLAQELNDRGVPCPADADQARNPHHQSAGRWIARTIALILQNPRYTGWQVWNRHATQGHGTGGRAGGRGSGRVRRSSVQDWEVSERPSHAPLVDETTFIAVQGTRAARPATDGQRREYALAGAMVCGECGRRMDAHWVHGRAGHRCRHGYSAGIPRPSQAPRTVYVREDHLLDALPGLLSQQGWEPPEDDVRQEVGEQLHRAGLEIVCSHAGWELRPTPLRAAQEPMALPGQTSLALEMDSTADQGDLNPHQWEESPNRGFVSMTAMLVLGVSAWQKFSQRF
ncbi:recombinase family protein [Saccharopolyspora shandongensis]|uniref:recombinase family protein n=1 Tax=Saccharopolyspora shandongensis TaxID=418495 RepID=UPI00341FC48A